MPFQQGFGGADLSQAKKPAQQPAQQQPAQQQPGQRTVQEFEAKPPTKKCPYISGFVAVVNPQTGKQEVKPATGYCLAESCTFWMGDKDAGICILALGFQTIIYASSSLAESLQGMLPEMPEGVYPEEEIPQEIVQGGMPQRPDNLPTIEDLEDKGEGKK